MQLHVTLKVHPAILLDGDKHLRRLLGSQI